MNRETFHVTFRTSATTPQGQPDRLTVHADAVGAWRKTAATVEDMTAVDTAGMSYDTDVTYTGETSFRRPGPSA